MHPIKREFRYERPIDGEYKHYRTYVTAPASKLAEQSASMWTIACFPSEFVDWMNENLVDDCFYNTTENPWDYHNGPEPAGHERFLMHFFFRNDKDAALFKLFWA